MGKVKASTYGRLKQRAYQIIREAILSGEFPPGEPVSDTVMAERFSIGRTPVREALHLLQKDGLVAFVPKKGWFVPPVALDEALEVYELREILEAHAVERATPRLSPEELRPIAQKFQGLAKDLDLDGSAGALQELYSANRLLHSQIAMVGAGRLMREVLENLVDRARRLLAYEQRVLAHTQRAREVMRALCAEHIAIISAITDKDPQRAKQAMVEHLRHSKQRYLDYFASGDRLQKHGDSGHPNSTRSA